MAKGSGSPKVVILCGGRGTRFREETEYRPKPMVEVGGRPILWHILKAYAHQGFHDFVLCLGYRGDMIKRYFLEYEAMENDVTIELGKAGSVAFHERSGEAGWKVTLVDTGSDAMTGARLMRARRHIDTPLWLMTYGDGVADVDLAKLTAFHRAHGKAATVTGVRPQSRFGDLIVQGDRVVRFSEKPQVHEGFINGGFFALSQKVFDYLSQDDSCVFERAPLERLAADGQLRVHRHEGYWQCMDTHRDWSLLEEAWKKGEAPWAVWERPKRSKRA